MFSSDSGSGIFTCDTIEYEGGLWLVPHWIENLSEQYQSPTRIIRMDKLKHQKISKNYPADYLLNEPMPQSILDGRAQTAGGVSFEVVEAPNIRIPLPSPHIH